MGPNRGNGRFVQNDDITNYNGVLATDDADYYSKKHD